MIRVSGENRKSPVELFGHHQASQCVGQRQRAEREKQMSPLAGCIGPTAGRSDGEDKMLCPLVAARAQPGCKGLRGHLLATAIEQHGDSGSSALLAAQPLEQRLLTLEGFCLAARKSSASV